MGTALRFFLWRGRPLKVGTLQQLQWHVLRVSSNDRHAVHFAIPAHPCASLCPAALTTLHLKRTYDMFAGELGHAPPPSSADEEG